MICCSQSLMMVSLCNQHVLVQRCPIFWVQVFVPTKQKPYLSVLKAKIEQVESPAWLEWNPATQAGPSWIRLDTLGIVVKLSYLLLTWLFYQLLFRNWEMAVSAVTYCKWKDTAGSKTFKICQRSGIGRELTLVQTPWRESFKADAKSTLHFAQKGTL